MAAVRRIIVLATTILMLTQVSPAFANHEPARNGPRHDYGDVVDYPMTFPVVGTNHYSSVFWARRGSGAHHAIDIMAAKMTPVVAVADGTIVRFNGQTRPDSTWTPRCCTLSIRHSDGWQSTYIHLNNDTPGTDDGQGWGIAPGLKLGSRVTAGQVIGWVGDSGNAESTSPHLHFELEDPDGIYVDPYQALKAAQTGVAVAVCRAPAAVSLSALTGGSGLIKAGSRGDEARQLQQFLQAVGYNPGPIDGVVGRLTVGAVRSFQEGRGINPDGVVGPVTRSNIAAVAKAVPAMPVLDPNGRVIRPGYRGEDVKYLQEILAVAGFDAGSADGIYGPKTESAVAAFQKKHGSLTVDGKLGPNTREALAAYLGLGDFRACS